MPTDHRELDAAEVVDHAFQPLGNDVSGMGFADELPVEGIQRHRTALTRTGLSAPMQALARHGFLDGTLTLFDYGCGRGDDIAALRAHGVDAQGWDPHFAPSAERVPADIVNLGFVINVIEDQDERIAALRSAHELAKRLLVVSTMLYGSTPPPGRRYRDGFLTQQNTFQKNCTQVELKGFVESAVGGETIPVAPGIMFVFTDEQPSRAFYMAGSAANMRCACLGTAASGQNGHQELRTRRTPSESSPNTASDLNAYGGRRCHLGDCPDRMSSLKHPLASASSGPGDAGCAFSKASRTFLTLRSQRANGPKTRSSSSCCGFSLVGSLYANTASRYSVTSRPTSAHHILRPNLSAHAADPRIARSCSLGSGILPEPVRAGL